MSWDVIIFNFEGDPPDFENLPEDFEPPLLGDAQTVRDRISEAIPGVDWSDPAWGVVEGDGWSIEFNHEATGQNDQIMLHVRGGGDPVTAIVKLCKANNWSAFDTSSGEFLDLDSPSMDGWTDLQAARDQVLAHSQAIHGFNKAIVLGIILFVIIMIIVLIVMKNR